MYLEDLYNDIAEQNRSSNQYCVSKDKSVVSLLAIKRDYYGLLRNELLLANLI